MLIPIKYQQFIIKEYYYFCNSIFNSKLIFEDNSVFWADKLICNDKEFYNGFPRAVYSLADNEESNIRIYYLCG